MTQWTPGSGIQVLEAENPNGNWAVNAVDWAPADEVRTVSLHQPLVDMYGRPQDLPVLGITVALRVELSSMAMPQSSGVRHG